MYNLWWFTIALGVVMAIGVFLWIFGVCHHGDWDNALSVSGIFISVITGTIFIVILSLSIALPLEAKKEYNEFIETQTMVEQVYNGSDYTNLENAGLNNAIIEVNKWLTNARASVKQYGNWSMYYALHLDSLEYIKLVKGDNG